MVNSSVFISYFFKTIDYTKVYILRKDILTDSLSDVWIDFVFIKNACFVAVQKAFFTRDYLRAKTNAELDFEAAKSNTAGSSQVPGHSPHPKLFAQLVKWREETAGNLAIDLYEVLPTRSMYELVQFLPTGSAELKKIKGIGDGKIRQFGEELMNIIEKYCRESGTVANLLIPSPGKKAPKPDTKALSFELFKAGKTIQEIAAERGFVTETIMGHLAHYIGLGELDIFKVMDREKVQAIEQFFLEKQTRSSAEAKAHFNEAYSYNEIKMVLRYLEKEGTE